MIAKIRNAELAVKAGKKARIILKMNALTDVMLVQSLVKAGRAGVEIDLILRGACILPVNAPGLDGRIRVRSMIGRLLEHSRIFYFEVDGEGSMWLSSADWMNRNMLRRVEVAWPIVNAANRERILQECCELYLKDNQDAWILNPDGTYQPIVQDTAAAFTPVSAQQQLLQKYANQGAF
jgi:polyphosphate kinase